MFPRLSVMHKRCVRSAKFRMNVIAGCLGGGGRNDGGMFGLRGSWMSYVAGLGSCVANESPVSGQGFDQSTKTVVGQFAKDIS